MYNLSVGVFILFIEFFLKLDLANFNVFRCSSYKFDFSAIKVLITSPDFPTLQNSDKIYYYLLSHVIYAFYERERLKLTYEHCLEKLHTAGVLLHHPI